MTTTIVMNVKSLLKLRSYFQLKPINKTYRSQLRIELGVCQK